MTCCEAVDPLVKALRDLIAYTDKQYLSQELRDTMTDALVAMANAEARICTVCWKNINDGNSTGTVVYGYVPPDPPPDEPWHEDEPSS